MATQKTKRPSRVINRSTLRDAYATLAQQEYEALMLTGDPATKGDTDTQEHVSRRELDRRRARRITRDAVKARATSCMIGNHLSPASYTLNLALPDSNIPVPTSDGQ